MDILLEIYDERNMGPLDGTKLMMIVPFDIIRARRGTKYSISWSFLITNPLKTLQAINEKLDPKVSDKDINELASLVNVRPQFHSFGFKVVFKPANSFTLFLPVMESMLRISGKHEIYIDIRSKQCTSYIQTVK